MDQNGTETISNINTKVRSVFYCPIAPEFMWDLNDTTLSWILVIITYIASPVTILLNTFAIIALNLRKELRKNSTILLTSLAVADLLVGAIEMPLYATIDVLILRQVSFEHICFLMNVPGLYSMYFVSFASLYHVTAIAWERYVAIVKWMDYKVIVTRKRVQKLAIIAWLGSAFTVLPPFLMQVAGVDFQIVEYVLFVWIVCATVSLSAIVYFYVMVFLGVRKRKISEISQVTALVRTKLESKVAKMTFLLTAAVIFSAVPAMVFHILGEAFPFLRSSVIFRIWELLIQLNSLVNPLLYCYKDRRFRNVLLELLRIRKPRAIQRTVGSVRYVRRKNQFGAAVEDAVDPKHVASPTRLIRTASCELAVVSDCAQRRLYKIMSKRRMSAPMLTERCSPRSLDDFQLRQPSHVMLANATIHADKIKKTIPKLPKDMNLSQGTTNLDRNTSRIKSFHGRPSVVIAKSWPSIEDTTLKRPRTAP